MYLTYARPGTSGAVTGLSRMDALDFLLNGTDTEFNKHTPNFFRTRTIKVVELTKVPIFNFPEVPHDIGPITSEHYITFRIPKASGGFRTIDAPIEPLKSHQRAIMSWINQDLGVLSHDSAYAYARGRCALDAMVTHQQRNAKWFLKLDIKDFFPSITSELLAQVLPKIAVFNSMPKHLLDLVITYATKDGVLPQGSPMSPVLSNLVMLEFDYITSHALSHYNKSTYCYTRYADDILISSPYDFDDIKDNIIQDIKDTFIRCGLPFEIKDSKTRYGSREGRNWNLGLMYNKDSNITVGHKAKRQLHGMLLACIKAYNDPDVPNWDVISTQELIGKLAYLKLVEPTYHANMLAKYDKIVQAPSVRAMFKQLLNI